MSIVLGGGTAVVWCVSGSRVIYFNLPYTNLNGRQIETHEPRKISHEVQSLDIDNPEIETKERILGYSITWDFSHVDFIDGADTVNYYQIMQYYKSGYDVYLMPRNDDQDRYFQVIPYNDSLSLGIAKGGVEAPFNTDFAFRFRTKKLVQDLKIREIIYTDPDLRIYVYGDDNFEEVLYAV